MRAIFVLVNYNADGKVCEFLESLACIALLESTDRIDVLIVDNSEKNLSARTEFCEKTSGYEGLNIEWIFEETNSGYFGPLAKVQKYIEGNDYQWVIYSNPDLLLDSKFLANLQRANDLHNGDLVAPSIIDGKSGGDQNPQYRLRPSKFKLRFLRALFSSNLFFNIYQNLGYLKQSLNHSLKELGFTASRAKITEGAASIYAGHGSLFIFKGCETFLALPKYPCFLFCPIFKLLIVDINAMFLCPVFVRCFTAFRAPSKSSVITLSHLIFSATRSNITIGVPLSIISSKCLKLFFKTVSSANDKINPSILPLESISIVSTSLS